MRILGRNPKLIENLPVSEQRRYRDAGEQTQKLDRRHQLVLHFRVILLRIADRQLRCVDASQGSKQSQDRTRHRLGDREHTHRCRTDIQVRHQQIESGRQNRTQPRKTVPDTG
ncbi:hypothetical protein SDC9_212294 [bioreactor metagenome]|uniref:Uncharacterized protein n=1 Tax=bioreactor metagenome TaxID=1076179 RepID=A0A645JP32_9ZZZZ